jgi:hypothetical protein
MTIRQVLGIALQLQGHDKRNRIAGPHSQTTKTAVNTSVLDDDANGRSSSICTTITSEGIASTSANCAWLCAVCSVRSKK